MKLLSLLICAVTVFSVAAQNDDKLSTSVKFDEVITYVNRMYVDEVDDEELTNTAIVALLEKLDPHSTFISKDEVDSANERINGNFVGVGIRFQILKDTLIVVSTIPGGPSEKIGLLAGDQILSVEDTIIAGIGLKNSEVRDKLLGDKGTKVKVTVKRRKTKGLLDFVITRDVIPVHSVDAAYMLTPETGYIKLNSFSRTSLEEVQEGMRSLKKQGMKNLIFDLQGNGGGLLYGAKYIADEFLSDDKLIVYSEGRSQPRIDLNSEQKGMFEKGKLILLTDEYSASASEILAGAVQDWDRGLIVGRRTYGKGLVQRPIDLSDGSQIRLTIARYYTPSGRFIQKPYTDADSYRKDLLARYENGEFMNQDSIKLPDSLMHTTLLKKRTVYSGGGIMPDYFVPMDTTAGTMFHANLNARGVINRTAIAEVDNNRMELLEKYPDVISFKENYEMPEDMISRLKSIASEVEVEWNEEEFAKSQQLISVQLMALVARDLYDSSAFYRIINDENDIYLEGLRIINDSENYDSILEGTGGNVGGKIKSAG